MPNILYLHGFASSPAGSKAAAIRAILGPRGFGWSAPDLNAPSFEALDFDAMVRKAAESCAAEPASVVVGSSLGAMVALGLARTGITAPLVLVAPALGFGDRWMANLGDADPVDWFHYGENRPKKIHRRFFEQMRDCDVDCDPPPAPVTIFMGRRDESVPFDLVAGVWAKWQASGKLDPRSRFVEVADGDHSLLPSAPAIAEEIARRAEETARLPRRPPNG